MQLISIDKSEDTGEFIIETECGNTIASFFYDESDEYDERIDHATALALANICFSAICKEKNMKEDH